MCVCVCVSASSDIPASPLPVPIRIARARGRKNCGNNICTVCWRRIIKIDWLLLESHTAAPDLGRSARSRCFSLMPAFAARAPKKRPAHGPPRLPLLGAVRGNSAVCSGWVEVGGVRYRGSVHAILCQPKPSNVIGTTKAPRFKPVQTRQCVPGPRFPPYLLQEESSDRSDSTLIAVPCQVFGASLGAPC